MAQLHSSPQTNAFTANAASGTGRQESSISAASVQLTIRMLMQSRDVGSIIGKGGQTISKFRSESHAHINITDGGAERIVTITGSTDSIFSAFSMISKKVEEGIRLSSSNTGQQQPPVSLRLLIPSSQCGPLIGKSGSKIKELRERTSTTVQVAGEALPNSTERAVTIAGTSGALSECLCGIAQVMLENPVRGPTMPYRPRQPTPVPTATQPFLGFPPFIGAEQFVGIQPPILQMKPMGNEFAHMAPNHSSNGTCELTIPNEFVGCVIGRGGHKISEIRRSSGATIRIANSVSNCPDRRISISGTHDCIATAHQLIQGRIQTEVANKPAIHSDLATSMVAHLLPPNVAPIPMLAKPEHLLHSIPVHGSAHPMANHENPSATQG